jgi:hypothetical protein
VCIVINDCCIFHSNTLSIGNVDIELAVMWEAIFEFELHAEFYNWLQNVVQTACADWRNTRVSFYYSLIICDLQCKSPAIQDLLSSLDGMLVQRMPEFMGLLKAIKGL